MPKLDFACDLGHVQRDQFVKYGERPRCPECGGTTDVIWQTSFPNIIRDEIPGGMTIHNMTAQPETFYSKSEHRRRMKELGLENTVRHVGHDHTDKSPHTTRWY